MHYVDGFVQPVPKTSLQAYFNMGKKAGKIWPGHDALEHREGGGDDLKPDFGLPFPRITKFKAGETVVVSWIGYKSQSHRDRVNAKVMKDPRLKGRCDEKPMPFDVKRMAYGGSKLVVEA